MPRPDTDPMGQLDMQGRFDFKGFLPWIERHASKLSIAVVVAQHAADEVVLRLHGPDELQRALALACSLGPKDVWVDRVVLNGDEMC